MFKSIREDRILQLIFPSEFFFPWPGDDSLKSLTVYVAGSWVGNSYFHSDILPFFESVCEQWQKECLEQSPSAALPKLFLICPDLADPASSRVEKDATAARMLLEGFESGTYTPDQLTILDAVFRGWRVADASSSGYVCSLATENFPLESLQWERFWWDRAGVRICWCPFYFRHQSAGSQFSLVDRLRGPFNLHKFFKVSEEEGWKRELVTKDVVRDTAKRAREAIRRLNVATGSTIAEEVLDGLFAPVLTAHSGGDPAYVDASGHDLPQSVELLSPLLPANGGCTTRFEAGIFFADHINGRCRLFIGAPSDADTIWTFQRHCEASGIPWYTLDRSEIPQDASSMTMPRVSPKMLQDAFFAVREAWESRRECQ